MLLTSYTAAFYDREILSGSHYLSILLQTAGDGETYSISIGDERNPCYYQISRSGDRFETVFLGVLLIYLVLSMEDRKLFQKMIHEENHTPEDCCRWILRGTEDLSLCEIYFSEEVVERAKHTEMGMTP